jgi:2',3'-cyclic-nucleotide 2'-phosphodiesterase (5'-nucleotidase family)
MLSFNLKAIQADENNKNIREETKIVIFHINDVHSHIDNFAKIAKLVEEERKINPDVFLMNAGDNFSGNPIVDHYVPKGEPILELMNRLKFDIQVIGNHDFDYGQTILKSFIKRANFPIICANVKVSGGVISQPEPYVFLKTKNGLKIAVLGIVQIDEETQIPSTLPKNIEGLVFLNGIEVAKRFRYLKKRSNIFIALSHMGYKDDELLAKEMSELDIIIGGHSHTIIENQTEINKVLITQAGAYGEYLGRIEITLKNGRAINKKAQLINLNSVKEEKPEIKAMIARFNDNPELNQVLTKLTKPLAGNSELGSLMTDAVRNVFDLDIVFQNSGGIRMDKLEGEVTIKDVYTLFPFENVVVQFKMTPAEIRTLIKFDYEQHKHTDLMVSGIQYTVKHTMTDKVKDIELRDEKGEFLDENKTYNVGLNSYVASVYKFSHKDPGRSLKTGVAHAIIQYLKQKRDLTIYNGIQRTFEEIVNEGDLIKIGKTEIEISSGNDPFGSSTSAGNLIADAMRYSTRVNIAVFPSRLQKRNYKIKAGESLFEEMIPKLYSYVDKNRVITGYMKGSDLKQFILKRSQFKNNIDLQVSGMKYKIYCDPEGKVVSVECHFANEEKIVDSLTYTIAFNAYDFNKYYYIYNKVKERSVSKKNLYEILIAYIRGVGVISSSIIEKRVEILRSKK